MSTFKEKIDVTRIPQHVAIIMDGNGRWAKERGYDRIFGHQKESSRYGKLPKLLMKLASNI